MDGALYENIIHELNTCRLLHVNDNIINFLLPKYPSLSTETLRSIIGLWYTRKIAALSVKIKDINIYKMYRDEVKTGNKLACCTISERTGYPPSLIAKIVLTGYLSENQRSKSKVDAKKVKQLRKPLCLYCEAKKNELPASINEDISSIKKHSDPRIELALNIFDEDDDIGQYFLDKFKYSTKISSNIKNKPQKFYSEASTFEQMGEKNVKKCNFERLFANPNVTERSPKKSNDKISTSKLIKRAPFSKVNSIGSDFSHAERPGRNIHSFETQKRQLFKIKDILNNFDDMKIESEVKNNRSSSDETSQGDLTQYFPNLDEQKCTCKTFSGSESDSDSDCEEFWDNLNVKELLENTTLIEDPVLAHDVFYCTISDDQYGPSSDIIANSLGSMYERILEEHIRKAGLPYKTENKLRGVGCDKTPDIILLVPVAVDGFVINWIESKALFADYKQHQLFKRSQFKNYINRFGPGLVIYWHGYVDDIPELYLAKKEMIVRDRFPPNESFTFVKSDKFKSWMQSESNTS